MQARCRCMWTGIDVTRQTTRRLPLIGGFVPKASFGWPTVLCLGAAFALQAQSPVRKRGPARSSRRFGRSTRPRSDRLRFQSLRQRLADRTFSNVDLSRAIAQAQSDARTNYSVEFEPSGHSWDGKFHKLRVAVARKGVHVQADNGYFAIAGS
jgi:hypothetical protein